MSNIGIYIFLVRFILKNFNLLQNERSGESTSGGGRFNENSIIEDFSVVCQEESYYKLKIYLKYSIFYNQMGENTLFKYL